MNKLLKERCQQKKNKKYKKFIFSIDIAKKYGVEAAIIIQHFQYSIDHHKRNGTHFHEGRFWTYDSIKNLTCLFPFWTTKIIRKIIKQLEDKKVILSGNFNKNKYNRTKWFSFKDEDKFLQHYESDESTEKPIVYANSMQSVDENVDNYTYPVDNPVDKCGIKNTSKSRNKNPANEPNFSEKSSVNRRNEHLPIWANPFAHLDKSILPINSSIYSSMEEQQPNNNNGGILKKRFGRKNTSRPVFASRITKDYVMHKTLREKLLDLGYTDHDIDREVQNMIKYHEENPQIVLNEHKCVLGWFKNHITRTRKRIM